MVLKKHSICIIMNGKEKKKGISLTIYFKILKEI